MTNKIRICGAFLLAALWFFIACVAWFAPQKDMSVAERRPLEKMPEITMDSILEGDFMSDFESYTLDQFPVRDSFRTLKSLVHKSVLQQMDNNGIYIADGYAAEMEYPLDNGSVEHALSQIRYIYDNYLKDTGSKVYASVVPDKGYYLAKDNGYLSLDYEKLFRDVQEGMPFAQYIDITDCLTLEDYYRTDTHWRQERILGVAQRIAQAMGVSVPAAESFTPTKIEKPFYGVYYGQAALPMEADELYVMNSQLLKDCKVFNYEKNTYTEVYDMEKLNGYDLYDVFLSGAQSMLRIENPNATTDRELMVFRDSFSSSLIPLLVQDYATVTLVDIRYVKAPMLGRFLEFNGQDVLFLYSALVLNKNLI